METLLASWDWGALLKILGVNLILSGDNAVLIALAAAGLPADQRPKAIMFGMVLAVVLRVVLSIFAVYLLAIPGLLLVGGLLLLWIAYGFYKELRKGQKAEEHGGHVGDVEPKTMATALRQIIIADVTMSLDNVLAVAGAARDNLPMLIIGLAISIIMMGVAATLISRLLERFPVVAYIGVALIVWIGVEMIWHDGHHLYERFVVGEHAATPPTGTESPSITGGPAGTGAPSLSPSPSPSR
jgi:YjbE family integral membrane protein